MNKIRFIPPNEFPLNKQYKEGEQLYLRNNRYELHRGPWRCGKTLGLCIGFLKYAIIKQAESDLPLQFGLCSRTHDQFSKVILPDLRLAASYLNAGKVTYNKGDKSVFIAGIQFPLLYGAKKGDAENYFGLTLHSCYIDELSRIPDEFMAMIESRCDNDDSKIIACWNPKTPKHYVEVNYWNNDELDSHKVQWNMGDNPVQSVKYIESLFATLKSNPAEIKRSIYGYPAAMAGLGYPIKTIEDPPDNMVLRRQRIAIDYASSGVTAVLLIGEYVNNRGIIHYITDEWRHDGNTQGVLTDEEQADQCYRWLNNNASNIHSGVYDHNASGFVKALSRQGIRNLVPAIKHDKSAGITLTNNMLQDGKLRISPKCKYLLQELDNLFWDEKKAEQGIDELMKGDDHSADAMRYHVTILRK